MKFISNQNSQTHLTEITKLLNTAEEVIFCVAFLKNSGLNSIAEQLKNIPTKCKLFIGTDFYLTEPSALRRLYKDGHILYLAKKNKTTYHPKIFYFKNAYNIDILIGSTNITSGGLENNIEASFEINTTFNSEIDQEFNSFLDSLIQYSTLVTSEEIISSYDIRFSAYHERHSKADEQFQIDLKKITEEELKNAEEKEKSKTTSNPLPKNKQFIFSQKDYDEFEIFLPRYVEYKTKERSSGVVNKDTGPKDLLKWYQGIKEFIKHEVLPEDIAKRLIDVDFPFGNGWDATIRMIWNNRYEKLLEYKENEQKNLNYTYVPQTKNTNNPYYKLGTWIAQQKQRRKGNQTPDWDWDYEENKMKAINYLWDRPELGGELDDEGWWADLIKLQQYYSDKRNYHSVPSQNTKLGKWLNDQMTLKRTGSRQKKEKKFLNKLREELLGELLKKNNVEWNWQVQLEREGILEGLKGWRELIEWEKQKGNRKPTDVEINYFKGIRNWKNTIRNRSKKWDRNKEKWKIDLLTKAGFPLPEPDN